MRCKPDRMLHHCQLDIETRLICAEHATVYGAGRPCRVYYFFIP